MGAAILREPVARRRDHCGRRRVGGGSGVRGRSDGGGDGARTRRSALTFTARPRSGLSPTQRPPLRPQIRPTCGQRCDRGEAFTNSQQGACKPSAAIGSQGLEAADDPSGHGAPPSPFTPHPDQLAYLRTRRSLRRIRTSSPTSEHAVYSAASGPASGLPPNTPFTPPHPGQLAYLRTRLLRHRQPRLPPFTHRRPTPPHPTARLPPNTPFTPPHPDQLAYLRLLRIRTSSPTSEHAYLRTASETMAAVLFICSQGLEAADDPSGHGTPPSPFTPHPDQPADLRTAYLRTASETMAAVLFICSQGLEAADDPSGHGTPPSPFTPHPDQPADLRTASETMAAVLFLYALGQPLVLAHLNGFTAIGPHASGSAWSAAHATSSASGPTRRPPNGLGDHGGRPLRLCPRPAPPACAPQRLHRHRPACLRLRPVRCDWFPGAGSRRRPFGPRLEAADDPSGHGTPPSPFIPHPDQLAYLRTRLPPNSLGDHGGRPLHLFPGVGSRR